MAIILGKDGGVIKPFANLVKFGLGGIQGNGNQMFSWIHIEDVYRIIISIQQNKNLSGVFNTAAPNPVTNKILMSSFRNVLNKSFGLPSPKWLLKIGAMLIKTETELILKSRWVIPERLQNEGYVFKYDKIDDALNNILNT
jgi:NAD dependent epimerase/dehydratase family enzyme